MFSIVSVCLPLSHYVHGRSHVTITHNALDLIIQRRPTQAIQGTHLPTYKDPRHPWTYSNLFNLELTVQGHPPVIYKLVRYEASTVGKRTVGILLECFLV